MFGNINNPTNKNHNDENSHSSRDRNNKFVPFDENENSHSSRGRNNKLVNTNRYNARNDKFTKSNVYDETTDSASSEEESEESQRFNKKPNNKKSRISELESIKKENIELKITNEFLMKLNNLSASILKTSNLMVDVSNEQKLINSRLEKLENDSKNKSIMINEQILISSRLEKLKNKSIIVDSKNNSKNNEDDILPIGDNSSVDVSGNLTKSLINDANKPILLPKMTSNK